VSTFELAIKWSFKLNVRPEFLSVCDGQTYVFASRSKFICLDNLTGETVWRISLKPGVRGIAANASHVYIASLGDVRAYSRIDGSLSWTTLLPPEPTSQEAQKEPTEEDRMWRRMPLIGPLSVSENLILAGGWRGYSPIYSLHPATGECRWAAVLAEPWVPVVSRLVRVADREWICAWADNQLLVLNPNSGEITERVAAPAQEKLWFRDLRNSEGSASWSGLPEHWLLQGEDSIYKFTPGEPSKLEAFAVAEPISALQTLASSDRAFYTNAANILKSCQLSTGEVETFGRLNHNLKYLLPVVGTGDGLFYVGTSFGFLNVFASDGKMVFRKKIAKGICTEMASLPDNSVIFGTASGQVMCCRVNLVGDL
jgi:hypothetical protein